MKNKSTILTGLLILILSLSVNAQNNKTMEKATFGAGCFWCVETIFKHVKGVDSVTSGYSGGDIKNPSYQQVASGQTNHAEAIQIHFDPQVISYQELLEIFYKTHDPTQLNRQGADVGPQYRSVIFYHDDKQKETATTIKNKLDKAGIWDKPIVTAIEPYKNFYPAEDYHQDYYAKNKNQGYCQIVITPKLEKFKEVFSDKMKASSRKE
ncbi:MAG: peptide-methionine (S)-S-oxide reductase MsrA [Bacteroidales bacterium]|nr:peptide-methionine (S)-S-oxide reductase MsrA [Bacteroidales bacterium]